MLCRGCRERTALWSWFSPLSLLDSREHTQVSRLLGQVPFLWAGSRARSLLGVGWLAAQGSLLCWPRLLYSRASSGSWKSCPHPPHPPPPKIVISVSCSVKCLVCPGLSYTVRGTSYDPWSLLNDSEPRCRLSGGRQCLQARFDSGLVQSVWCLGLSGFLDRVSIINPSYGECVCSTHSGVKLLMVVVEFWALLAKSHVEEGLALWCSS